MDEPVAEYLPRIAYDTSRSGAVTVEAFIGVLKSDAWTLRVTDWQIYLRLVGTEYGNADNKMLQKEHNKKTTEEGRGCLH